MDLDISDILADVSRTSYRTNTSQPHQQQPYDLASSAYTDHQRLLRAWTSERTSPTLLPYPTQLITRTMTRIRDQITRIEDLTSGMDSSLSTTTATTTGKQSSTTNQNTNLILSILQTDLSRTQFIVRSYLRQRLDKISRHAVYWLKHHVSSSPESKETHYYHNLLSQAEISFLKNHQALLSEFYDASFLASFPPNLRRLDDSAGGVNMVDGPDLGASVIVRCLASGWDNGDEVASHGDDHLQQDEKADVELRLRRGEVWAVRFRDVRSGVIKGDLELL